MMDKVQESPHFEEVGAMDGSNKKWTWVRVKLKVDINVRKLNVL